MKNLKYLILCFATLISTSAFAIFGGGGGSQTAVLLKILLLKQRGES